MDISNYETYDSYSDARSQNEDCEIFVNSKGKYRAIKDAPTSHFANGWKLVKSKPESESFDVSAFNVDKELQVIAESISRNGIQFCGGVFDLLGTGEEFVLTISKGSALKRISEHNERLKERVIELESENKKLTSQL